MRTAILSDIHGNLEALRACVGHARRQGVDGWAFLGDFVNYGADPVACLDLVRELAGAAPMVQGNHDEAALGGLAEAMNPIAREALYWTRRQLTAADRDFLGALPQRAALEGALLVHASAHDPGAWDYIAGPAQARQCLAATDAPVVFAGHLHVPTLYHCSGDQVRAFLPPAEIAIPLAASRRWLVLAGATGQPRDGISAAAYMVYDSGRREVAYHRVPYDHGETARKILAAGLPEVLAWRLARGI